MEAKLSPCVTRKQFFRGRVKNLSTLDAILNIKSKLNPSQLERFEASCFGRVFLMSTELEFSAQLVHHLLLRQADHPSRDEMWFVIGGKSARFSLHEFALVTGLDCGEYPSPAQLEGKTQSTRLREKYFNGRRSIHTPCLKQQFLSCVDDEDTFRLSLVYFLQALLLSRQSSVSIDQQWLSLVDDLESFNKFPWGKLCYETTLSVLQKPAKAMLARDLENKFDPTESKVFSYSLGGFPYALQMWAYEAIPILGRKYASKKGNLIPRILSWETPIQAKYKELREAVFSSEKLDVLKTLRATEFESKQVYMKSIAKFNDTLEDMDGGSMQLYQVEKSADSVRTTKSDHRIIKKQFSPTSIISLTSLKSIQVIKGKLNPSQHERFESSCFGKLFRLPANIKLSRNILRQLFSRKVGHREEKEMWFDIGGKRARFSQYEFALITGLNCGQYPSCTELKSSTGSTRLKDKYFNGRNKITRNCLKQQFLSCSDEDDTFKLAMVYFLETVLLGRCLRTSIEHRWLSLIDDVEAFNSFAWGKLSYERTLCSLRTAASRHDPRTKIKKSYRLSGFPYAFQVWAYKAIPFVASKYAEKAANLIPRVLCWEYKDSANDNEIDPRKISAENVTVMKTLQASVFENEQNYMKSIAEFTRMSEDIDGTMKHGEVEISMHCARTGKNKRKTLRAGNAEVCEDEKSGDEINVVIIDCVPSWVRGNGKRTTRKRRKMESSYVAFPFSEPSEKQTLVTGETVCLDPVRHIGKDEIGDLLDWLKGYQNDSVCLQAFVNECLGKHDSSMDEGNISMETEQEQQRSVSVAEKQARVYAAGESIDIIHQNEPSQPVREVKNTDSDAFVCDRSRSGNPFSVDLVEQLDAVFLRELDLVFSGKGPTQPEADLPALSIKGNHVDVEVIELSDDD